MKIQILDVYYSHKTNHMLKLYLKSIKTMKYMLTLAAALRQNYRDILANVNYLT